MQLKSCMVTERRVRRYAGTHTLAAKMTGILNFITMLLCLLVDIIDMPAGIRIYLRRQHGTFSSRGTRAVLTQPAFFSVHN